MAITYSSVLLNRYLAPGISEFTSCDAPDITADHPEAPHWLANHFLNSAFRGTFKNKYRKRLGVAYCSQTQHVERSCPRRK
jgi:hypothetical protein